LAPRGSTFSGNVGSRTAKGELVCLDDRGRPGFLALLYRRGTPRFVAFDLLAVDGRDIRGETLKMRKRGLARVVPSRATSGLALQPIVGNGVALFDAVCAADLEDVVAERLDVKNPTSSQASDMRSLC
jgi:bifunctional non-homologous end joining protein LigD